MARNKNYDSGLGSAISAIDDLMKSVQNAKTRESQQLYSNVQEVVMNASKFNTEEEFGQAQLMLKKLNQDEGLSEEQRFNIINLHDHLVDSENNWKWTTNLKAKGVETEEALDKLLKSGEWESSDLEDVRSELNTVMVGARGHTDDALYENFVKKDQDILNLIEVQSRITNYDKDPTTFKLDPFHPDDEDFQEWYSQDVHLQNAWSHLLKHEGTLALKSLDMFEDFVMKAELDINYKNRVAADIATNKKNLSKNIIQSLAMFDEQLEKGEIDEDGQLTESFKLQTGNPDFAASNRYAEWGDYDSAKDSYEDGLKSEPVRQFAIMNQAYETRLDEINQFLYVKKSSTDPGVSILPFLTPLRSDQKFEGLENIRDQRNTVNDNIGKILENSKLKTMITREDSSGTRVVDVRIADWDAMSPAEKASKFKRMLANSSNKSVRDITDKDVMEFFIEGNDGHKYFDMLKITTQGWAIWKDSLLDKQTNIKASELIPRIIGSYLSTNTFLNDAESHMEEFVYGPSNGPIYGSGNLMFQR